MRSKLQKYFQKKEKQSRIKLLKSDKSAYLKSRPPASSADLGDSSSSLLGPGQPAQQPQATPPHASLADSGEEEDQDDSSDDQRSREGGFLEEVERRKQASRLQPSE